MKKLIAILLTLTMILSLAACVAKEAPAPVEPEKPAESAPVAPPDMEEEPETPAEPTDEPVAPEEETPAEEETPVEDVPAEEVPAEPTETLPGDKLIPVVDAVLADVDAEFKEYFTTMPVEGDAETVGWMLGVSPMPEGYGEILFYGPMHGSTPFLMAVIEMTEGTEGRVFETAMMDNADLVKWVCVEADYVQAATNGSLCLFLMSAEDVCSTELKDQIFANFAAFDAASIG